MRLTFSPARHAAAFFDRAAQDLVADAERDLTGGEVSAAAYQLQDRYSLRLSTAVLAVGAAISLELAVAKGGEAGLTASLVYAVLFCASLLYKPLSHQHVRQIVSDRVDERFGAHLREGDQLQDGQRSPEAHRRYEVDVQPDGDQLLIGLRTWQYRNGRGWTPNKDWNKAPVRLDADDIAAISELRGQLTVEADQRTAKARAQHHDKLRRIGWMAAQLPAEDPDTVALRRLEAQDLATRSQQAAYLADLLRQRPSR